MPKKTAYDIENNIYTWQEKCYEFSSSRRDTSLHLRILVIE